MRRNFGVVWCLLAMVAVIGASGCNTMEGLGEDIENTGDAIEEEAED